MPRKPKKSQDTPIRPTIYDSIEESGQKVQVNKYSRKDDLENEASVETFFVNRLLKDLGYKDYEIRTKESLDRLPIPRGHRRELYRPDYVIVCSDKPRWLLDAKATDEKVDDWIDQCSGYALALNRRYSGEKPLHYYAITNGIAFKLFKWDENEPEMVLNFSDFTDDNQKFQSLKSKIGAYVVRQEREKTHKATQDFFKIKRSKKEEVIKLFNNCHRTIWKTEILSPTPAFFEFVKILFVKLWKDRELHEDPEISSLLEQNEPIPKERVMFSTHWIDSQVVEDPINTILFEPLISKFEESVERKDKKRIFNSNEKIKLHPGTIRMVVSKLESHDLYGVDEDLNGRLFEAFLSATMRGQALGQFFTPRSIVKLMTKLADLKANRKCIDKVLDGCCGTGGFLIEVLTEMRNQVRDNTSLSGSEKKDLLKKIANESIFGIDAGRDPPIARIARINMYLHGDGGSRIYLADTLDKSLIIPETKVEEQNISISHQKVSTAEERELKYEVEELKNVLESTKFNVVLTNPPFSMDYSSLLPNAKRILKSYELTTCGLEDTSNERASLRSSIMFLERYADLLDSKGRLLTVMDESILSSETYRFARDFIREKFIIRGVISLSGDAFQRVGARAKTSILYLIKRPDGDNSQPDVFMYESEYIGLDDVPTKTPPSKVSKAREMAVKETDKIVNEFNKYLKGERGDWLVPASVIRDRLDVKFCLPRKDNIVDEWKSQGYEILTLDDVVYPVDSSNSPNEVVNPKDDPEKIYTLLKVTYEGIPMRGESRLGKEISYSELIKIHEGDIVISNIAAVLGSTSVITKDLPNLLVSSEFTILRIKDKRFNPMFLWGFLRSAEVRARLLSEATGISRHRVKWEFLKNIPIPLATKLQAEVSKKYRTFFRRSKEALEMEIEGHKLMSTTLDTDNEWAKKRLKVAKPPR